MPADDAPPIATATVARLYMEQGKLDQAEQIYRGLLRDSPQDPRILQGIEEVRRRRDELLGTASDDVVALEPLPDGELTCRWRVSVEGRARAGLVLGGSGTLVRSTAIENSPAAIWPTCVLKRAVVPPRHSVPWLPPASGTKACDMLAMK